MIADAGWEAQMAVRTRQAGALSHGLLATAIVGVMAVVAACGSVGAGPRAVAQGTRPRPRRRHPIPLGA